jgi:hypothetical protein
VSAPGSNPLAGADRESYEDSLWSECVLPGCGNLVPELGEACSGCLEAFGSRLRFVPAPPPLSEEDQAAVAEFAARRQAPELERRANQRCWLCEERRTCIRTAAGWECPRCAAVTGEPAERGVAVAGVLDLGGATL